VQFRVNESQIRLFGGGAGLAARQLPFTIVDSPVQRLLKCIAPMTKQRIPPRRSAASLPRFLGESAAAERKNSPACGFAAVLPVQNNLQ